MRDLIEIDRTAKEERTYAKHYQIDVCTCAGQDEPTHSTDGRKRQPMDFKVSLVPPAGITASGLRAYIREAIVTRRGKLQSDDPFFTLDTAAVRVTRAL